MRAGSNTLLPYDENPPDLIIAEDDILFLDLGPVFEEWEADFGRTFVIGSDPLKKKLRDDIEKAFAEGKEYFNTHSEITAAELYRHAQDLATKYGWEFGGPIARSSARPIPSRTHPQRQNFAIRSSRESHTHAPSWPRRPRTPLDPRNTLRRPRQKNRRLLRTITHRRLI